MKIIRSPKLKSVLGMLLLAGVSWQASADSRSTGLSYSPDHWPTRWSSAIRQKQNGQFPTRQKQPQSVTRRTNADSDSVSERDLFYQPDRGRRYSRDYESDLDTHAARHRYLRDARRFSRDAAFAYNDMANMLPPYGGYASYGYGIGMDPVLGHPGIGIPFLPGIPLGYPIGVAPFGAWPYSGYPLGMGAWNPPFGVW